MSINKSIYRWISTQNHNLPLIGAITFSFPERFLRSIYRGRPNGNLWKGRKVCLTLSFDCDYPEDVQALPGLLKLLAKYPFKASFACVGAWIEKYPKEHALILEYGHEIVNHTYSHPDNELLNPGRRFRSISRGEKKEEVEKCHEICLRVLGYEPKGCRIPHFKTLFTDEIYGILRELGYAYSSSTWLTNTISHGIPFGTSESIVEFPVSVCPRHPFTVFDTWHSLHSARLAHRLVHNGPGAYVQLFERLIRIGLETGAYLNIYLDPLDVSNIPDLERVFDILADETILVKTYEEYLTEGLPTCEVFK